MSKISTKETMVAVFEDTKAMYANDPRLQKSIRDSITGTVVYGEDNLPRLGPPKFTYPMSVSVSRRRSFEAAMRWADLRPGAKIAVLNFASGTNPGGGVERGSLAQEEALCRCSTLFPVLQSNTLLGKSFYGLHKTRHDPMYSDACIYTPGIEVFKSDTDVPERLSIGKWRRVDVITCAAPNLSAARGDQRPGREDLLQLHKTRARKIFSVAAVQNVNILILGAFGCGAFRNPPDVVAQAYREVLEEFDQQIPRVEFAIFCPPGDDRNYRAFAKVMR